MTLVLPYGPKVWNPRMPSSLREGLAFAGGMEHPGSTHYHDGSGLGNHGALTNMAPQPDWAWSSELGRWVLNFLGGTRYVPLSRAISFRDPNQITLAAWVNMDPTGTSLRHTIFGCANQASVVQLEVNRRETPNQNQNLTAIISGVFVASATPGWLGGWRHICYTRSGTGAGTHALYRDGESLTLVDDASNNYVQGTTPTELGRRASGSQVLVSPLADPLAFNHPLDPAEVQWLANPANHLRVPWRRKSWLVGGSAATAPSFTATAGLVASAQNLAASAAHTPPAFTAAADLVASPQTLAASATHTPPAFTAAADLVASAQTLGAAATFAAEPQYTATAGLEVSAQTLSAAATFAAPPDTHTATATLVASSQVLAGAESPILWYADTLRLYDGATEIRQLAAVGTLPGVVPLLAAARNGPGTAALRYTAAGAIQYKAPGSSTWGPAVTLPAHAIPDDTWLVRDGDDADKWLRVQVYADYLPSVATEAAIELADVFGNAVGKANCAAADALAGEVISWEITCTNTGDRAGPGQDLTALTWWLTPPAGTTLEISDDGLSWVAPTSEGTGLVLGTVAAGASTTLHVRRTLAADSDAAPSLLSQLHASYTYRGESYRLDARGRFRVFSAAGYRLHWTEAPADPPAEDDAHDAFAELPNSPADVFGDGVHYFAVAAYNGCMASGFAPVGPAGERYLRLEIAGGVQAADPPAAPYDVQLTREAGGVIRVHAIYVEGYPDRRADQWAIAYTVDSGDPAEGAPAATPAIDGSTMAVLSYALPPQSHGATVRVRVQARRNDGTEETPSWVYSRDSEVVTLTVDATGPTEPLALNAT